MRVADLKVEVTLTNLFGGYIKRHSAVKCYRRGEDCQVKYLLQTPAPGMGRVARQTFLAFLCLVAVVCEAEDTCPGE